MIVDGDYFERTLLPETIERALPAFFGDSGTGRPAATVRNGAGELVYVDGHLPGGRGPAIEEDASRALPFVFTDGKIGVHAGGATPEKLARANFLLNLTFSILTGLVLLAGVLLALRTAA